MCPGDVVAHQVSAVCSQYKCSAQHSGGQICVNVQKTLIYSSCACPSTRVNMHVPHMVGTHTLHDGKFCSIAYLIAVMRYNPVKAGFHT